MYTKDLEQVTEIRNRVVGHAVQSQGESRLMRVERDRSDSCLHFRLIPWSA